MSYISPSSGESLIWAKVYRFVTINTPLGFEGVTLLDAYREAIDVAMPRGSMLAN